jgi:hypothetical protein
MSGRRHRRGGPLFAARAAPLAVAVLATLLAACSGDFDRPRPLAFGEDSTFGVPLALIESPQSEFAFTDAERRMRELAYPLLLPPGVCLHLRAAAYRYAAQRLAIAVPSHLLADVDRKLASYERRINFDGVADAAPLGRVHK